TAPTPLKPLRRPPPLKAHSSSLTAKSPLKIKTLIFYENFVDLPYEKPVPFLPAAFRGILSGQRHRTCGDRPPARSLCQRIYQQFYRGHHHRRKRPVQPQSP